MREKKEIKIEKDRQNHFSILKKETELLRKQLSEKETQIKQLIGGQIVTESIDRKLLKESKVKQYSENLEFKTNLAETPLVLPTQTSKVTPDHDNRNVSQMPSLEVSTQTEVNNVKTCRSPKQHESIGSGFPKITYFSGFEPVQKGETSLYIWKYEINCLKRDNIYPEYVIKQAIRHSLRRQAQRVSVSLAFDATSDSIISKLENPFGNVKSGDSVLQEFYNEQQKENEAVSDWGLRLEEIIRRAIEKGDATEQAKDKMLRNKLLKHLRSDKLKQATQIYYKQVTTFEELRTAVKLKNRNLRQWTI